VAGDEKFTTTENGTVTFFNYEIMSAQQHRELCEEQAKN
jgi:hypothetical protein